MSGRKRFHLIVKSDCPWCEKAQSLLGENNYRYDVDVMDKEPELLLEIKKSLGFKTVPMIWEIDYLGSRTFVGGYDDLVQHLDKGKRLLNG